jgi:hypothetical protein
MSSKTNEVVIADKEPARFVVLCTNTHSSLTTSTNHRLISTYTWFNYKHILKIFDVKFMM